MNNWAVVGKMAVFYGLLALFCLAPLIPDFSFQSPSSTMRGLGVLITFFALSMYAIYLCMEGEDK